MTQQTLNDQDISDIHARLQELQTEHRDIDNVINHLAATTTPDELLIRRLKKRKLLLKDRITQLEQILVPDVPA